MPPFHSVTHRSPTYTALISLSWNSFLENEEPNPLTGIAPQGYYNYIST